MKSTASVISLLRSLTHSLVTVLAVMVVIVATAVVMVVVADVVVIANVKEKNSNVTT